MSRKTKQERAAYRATCKSYPARKWSAAEDELVLGHKIPDRELSALIKRSMGAISVRRSRLKAKGGV